MLAEQVIMNWLIDCDRLVTQATSWSSRSLCFGCIPGYTTGCSHSSTDRIPDCTSRSCSCSAAESVHV